ncbi:recombinase family protein [Hahella sp. SMD15-11]|uniref:Recombinase family protein n=1 Tax=Thermohahella caldifontis TaxID=3142973 RepID=A0AB39UZI8_9GAMM
MAGKTKCVRCVVYTRKSSEEGLEQEFNSLDAQREAGEAYIRSQKHEGWVLLPDRYDDGGYSGGSMDRPGLRRLLDDVKTDKIDVVVVYKVDRLSRSLGDFAQIIDLFDKHGVSFVSVTQQFNTTTSMGRLTLNILLSFAQFEREVTGERIRDKIALSKKKGMWMGGHVPLGYDVANRKLVPNELEAALVRRIFNRFVRLGSTTLLCKELNEQGFRTKRRRGRDGRMNNGFPFTKTTIYKILKNRLYLGEIRHKDKWYPGNTRPSSTRTCGTRPRRSWRRTAAGAPPTAGARRRRRSRGCSTAPTARR